MVSNSGVEYVCNGCNCTIFVPGHSSPVGWLQVQFDDNTHDYCKECTAKLDKQIKQRGPVF